ncbi:MAG: hypothetical protein PF436_13695 [Prolixibacteraceae bacterium]|nr:hypothetical protein [Prolixibacteraceae bacterium]
MQPTRSEDASRTEVGTDTSVNAEGLEATPGASQHFVSVLTYDSIKWYINGYKISSTPLPEDVQISKLSTENAWIGAGAWLDPSWMGEILEVNIYIPEKGMYMLVVESNNEINNTNN